MAKDNDEKKPIIIIKRVKKVQGGHHGGAWKVAYADFVTAMMAFFLLMWLLNVTTKEEKLAISAYFSPADPRIAESVSGSGGVMGGTTVSDDGSMTENQSALSAESSATDTPEEKAEKAEMDKADEKAFEATEEKIKQAIEQNPELKEFAQNLLIDMTPEGLRIQIVDQAGKPMFELGSARPLPHTEKLLGVITSAIKDLPNKLSVRGHTDAKPYGKDAAYTNWELSSDRANASRRVMLASGLDVGHLENVQGKADREPLIPADPDDARNRRISIILLKQSLVAGLKKPVVKKTKSIPDAPQPRKKEEGVIYFP